ncbi:RipA family octameric membrane protein [Lentzea sp. NPDC004789]
MAVPFSEYFRTRPIDVPGVRAGLWTAGVAADQAVVLEQYKMCVEMADRVSARRALANGFFLSLTTATLTAAGALWQAKLLTSWLLALALLLLLVQNGAWFWLVRSYRQLNAAKYVVIGMLEEKLPASPYWQAEWRALGEGLDRGRYWPLTRLEQWLPVTFAVLDVVGFVLAVVPR